MQSIDLTPAKLGPGVVPSVNIVYVRDYVVAFAALKDGSVDAFPTDESVLRAMVQQDGHPDDYLFLPDFAKSRNVGFALKKAIYVVGLVVLGGVLIIQSFWG